MSLTPLLMFIGRAEEAMSFYTSVLPDAEILHVDRYGPDDPSREGTVKIASIRIANETLRCIDSPDVHAFTFTPAISFVYECPDEATFDSVFEQLSDQGSVFMPPGQYPFAERFAWFSDRFGVSWQLSVVPE